MESTKKHEESDTKAAPAAAPVHKSVSDDNLMAAISHAGIILLGIIIPLLIWVTQKEKSKYVEFQAKQALVYQLAVAVIFTIMSVIIFILAVISMGILGILYIALLPLILVAVLYGLYAAYQTYQGKDFRYIIIGDMLAK
jgi:uncharacterized Tic20 family protein